MDILKTIVSKTCFFVIKTSFENDHIIQEYGAGRNGHLMRWNPAGGFDKYYKFLIYPDPSSKGKYRLVNCGWPEFDIVMESNRARLYPRQDSDYLRYEFRLAQPPAIEKNKNEEWNYLHGIAENKHFDFSTIRYVYPSTNPGDGAKLKFIPIDIVSPDPTRVRRVSPAQENLSPPEDFVPVNGMEYGLREVSTEAIPAALISDPDYRNKSDQVALSPYYYLKHEQLWTNNEVGITELSRFNKTSDEKKYHYAFESHAYKSLERTVGHTFNAEVLLSRKVTTEAGVKEGPVSGTIKNELGASLKLAYQYQDQTKTINTSSSDKEESFTDTIKVEYRQLKDSEDEFFFRHWLLVDRYTLINTKGEVKNTWDYVNHKMVRSQKENK